MPSEIDLDLFILKDRLAEYLDRIKRLMPPGYNVTLVLRSPRLQAEGKDGDVVIGDDDLAEAAVAIARAVARRPQIGREKPDAPPTRLAGPSGA